jgi:FkbM family methyltransferase
MSRIMPNNVVVNGLTGSLNIKYDFKVKYDQFGNRVHATYVDTSELILVDIFEKLSKDLLDTEQQHYNMVELGSNQAYYSLLFKSMCKKHNKRSQVICVEPNDRHMLRGKEHFHMNNLHAYFCDYIIGDYELIKKDLDASNLPGGSEFLLVTKKEILTLSQLLEIYNISELDILHMDVDHSERAILASSEHLFKNKKIKKIFISTHRPDLHKYCFDFLKECGYKLELQITKMIVGYDSLLVFSL